MMLRNSTSHYRFVFFLSSLLAVVGLAGCFDQFTEAYEIPKVATEDVSSKLVKPPTRALSDEERALGIFQPDEKFDWVVTFVFDENVTREQIEEALPFPWYQAMGMPTVYVYQMNADQWVFLEGKHALRPFNRIKIAWPVWDSIEKERENVSEDKLKNYAASAEAQFERLDLTFQAIPESVPSEVMANVEALPQLVEECDQEVTLRLVAPDGKVYPGLTIWDVMLCLGLTYGDGDLFHWINTSKVGGDFYFTVATTTPPGYFSDERIAKGEGGTHDLVFSFSIPRSVDPVLVFESMANAAEYAQDRLGGTIQLESGAAYDRAAIIEQIQAVVTRLNSAGFEPGQPETMRIF